MTSKLKCDLAFPENQNLLNSKFYAKSNDIITVTDKNREILTCKTNNPIDIQIFGYFEPILSVHFLFC